MTTATTDPNPFFEVKAGTQNQYHLGLEDWLGAETIVDVSTTWTPRDGTQVSVVVKGTNSSPLALTLHDGSVRTFPIDTVASAWLLVDASVLVGDVILIDVAIQSTGATPLKDTRVVELRVVDRYSV